MAKKKKNKKKPLSPEASRATSEIIGLLMCGFMVMVVLSLISFTHGEYSTNWIGIVGNSIGWIFLTLFGVTSYLIVGYIAWIGLRMLFLRPVAHPNIHLFYFILAAVSTCMLFSVSEDVIPAFRTFMEQTFYPRVPKSPSIYHVGGTPAYLLYQGIPAINLKTVLNSIGVAIIFSSTLVASILYFFKSGIVKTLYKFVDWLGFMKEKASEIAIQLPLREEIPEKAPVKTATDFMRYVKLRMGGSESEEKDNSKKTDKDDQKNMLRIEPTHNLVDRPSISRKTIHDPIISEPPPRPRPAVAEPRPLSKRDEALRAQRVHNGDFTQYRFPPLSLLTTPPVVDQSKMKSGLRRQAEVLEETLMSFGIEAKVGQINCGPTITSFEVHPAIGVKVQKILALENDIALNMEAKSIRIIAPIPGKAAIGIEVPNPHPVEVGFKDLMQEYQNHKKKYRIPILLGKAVAGEYVMSDLAKMPHCIIAGATGAGKSVCINTLIMSILFTARPDEVQMIMIDPKKVELTPYSNLPHMIAPVITEPHGAYTAMQWLVKEMEQRYEILKQVGVRNIDAFNTRKINKEQEAELTVAVPEKLPYIVGIVDELADLMMVSSSDIETPIARIAQMARAVGIHLVLATQRPSREVITGLIKANFPTRISFKVSSRVNSQIILDAVGAESLLGNGDMLFLPPGSSQLIRAQGAFIRDEDIHAVIQHICDQAPTNYRIPSFDKMLSLDGFLGPEGGGKYQPSDDLYEQAFGVVTGTGNASTTFLQRKLKIGYARAASLMDELEAQGVVSPAEGSKSRRVLQGGGNASDEDGE